MSNVSIIFSFVSEVEGYFFIWRVGIIIVPNSYNYYIDDSS